jgi:hypothetical protein
MAKSSLTLPSWTQVEIGITKLAAVASAVEGSTDLGGLPKPIRVALLGVAGFIIGVNHYFNKQTTAVAPPKDSTPPAPEWSPLLEDPSRS